nr:HAMP domain-containing protein [Thermoanaerobacterales bacterium]
MAVVTTIEVINSAEEVDKVRSQTELARSVTGPNGLITALQDERTWPAVDLIGQGDAVRVNVAGYDETRQQTDEALANFREELSSKADAIARAYAPALEQLEAELPGIRADIDHNVATVPNRTVDNNIDFSHQIFDRYTAVIEPFFDATTRISLAVDDPELRQGTELADAAAREYETMSLLLNRVIGYATTSPGGLDQPQEIADVSILHARFRLLADTLTSGTGPYAEIADQYFPHELVANVNEQVDRAVTTGQFDLGVLLDAVNVPEEEGFLIFQEAIKDEIEARSNELESAAERRQQLFLLLAAVVVGAAVVLAWLVSRSITRPLRALTREAKDMAERRLPEAVTDILQTPLGEDVAVPHVRPVRVNARDEVADVADALNTVQDTALDLAVEQAVLRRNIADSFVNLGRRNQNLLGRQLDFITELESKET